MALNIKIDLEKTYKLEARSYYENLHSFHSTLADGKRILLGVKISDETHPLLPNVYNLSFGPLNEKNEIDDRIKLAHKDHSKVFSTIILSALTFLSANKHAYLGIDGSSSARAYMYYRCILNNFEYLSQFLKISGAKYYIRILKGDDFDWEDIIALPTAIKKGDNIKDGKLYDYIIFNAC